MWFRCKNNPVVLPNNKKGIRASGLCGTDPSRGKSTRDRLDLPDRHFSASRICKKSNRKLPENR